MYRLLRYDKDGKEVAYKINELVSKNLYDKNNDPCYKTSQLDELPPGIMPEETTDNIDVLAYIKGDSTLPISGNISKIINDHQLREKIQYVLGVGTQEFSEDDEVVKILKSKLVNFEQVTLDILALKKLYPDKAMQEFKAMLSLYKKNKAHNPNFVSFINSLVTAHKLRPEDINEKITEAVRILSYLEHGKEPNINNYVVNKYLLRDEGLKSPDINGLTNINGDNYALITGNYTASKLNSKLAFKDSLAEITPEIEKILKEIIMENPDATLSANGFGELFVTLNEGEPKIPLRGPEGFVYKTSETNIGSTTPILIDQVAAIVKSALYQGKEDNIVSCTIPLGSEQDKSINEQRNTIIKILGKLNEKDTYTNPAYINVIRKYFYIPEDILEAAFEGRDVTELLRNKNFIFQIQNGRFHYVSVSMKIDHENNISVQYKDSFHGSVSSFNNIPDKTRDLIQTQLVSSIKKIGNTQGKTSFINTPYTEQQNDTHSCGFWTAVNSLRLGGSKFIPENEYDNLRDLNIRNKIFSKLKPWSINGKIDETLMIDLPSRSFFQPPDNKGRNPSTAGDMPDERKLFKGFLGFITGFFNGIKAPGSITSLFKGNSSSKLEEEEEEAKKTKINEQVNTSISELNSATSKDDFIAKCKLILENELSEENTQLLKNLLGTDVDPNSFLEDIIKCSEIENTDGDLLTGKAKKIFDIYIIISDENNEKINKIKEVLKDIKNDIIDNLISEYANQNEKINKINRYLGEKDFYNLFLMSKGDKDLIVKILEKNHYQNTKDFLTSNKVEPEDPTFLINFIHALYDDFKLNLDDFCTSLESIPINKRIEVISNFEDNQHILLKAIEKSDIIAFIHRTLPLVKGESNDVLKGILDNIKLTEKTIVKAQEILTKLKNQKYDNEYITTKQEEIINIISEKNRLSISALDLSLDARKSLSSAISITPENEDNSSTILEKLSTIVEYSTKVIKAALLATGSAIISGIRDSIKKLKDYFPTSDERGGTDSAKTPLLSANTMQNTQGPVAKNMYSSNYLGSAPTEHGNNNSNDTSTYEKLINIAKDSTKAIMAIPVAAGAAIISGIGDSIKKLKDYFPTSYAKVHISDDPSDDPSEVSYHNDSEIHPLLPKLKVSSVFKNKVKPLDNNQQNQTYATFPQNLYNNQENQTYSKSAGGKKPYKPPTRKQLFRCFGEFNFLRNDYIEVTQVDSNRLGEPTKPLGIRLKNADNETNYPSLIAANIYSELENEDAKSALRTLFLKNFPVDGNQADQYSNLEHFIKSVQNEDINERIKQMIIDKAYEKENPRGILSHDDFNQSISDDGTELCFGPFGSNIARWNSRSFDDDTVECVPSLLGGGRSRFYSDASDTPLTFSGGGRAATPPKQTLFPPMPPSTFLNAVIHSPPRLKASREENFESLLDLARKEKTNISAEFEKNNPGQPIIEDKFTKHNFRISYEHVADNQEQKEQDIMYMAASAALDLKLEPVIIYGGTYEEQIIAIKSALKQGFTAITVAEPKKGEKTEEYTQLLNLTRKIRDNYKSHGDCLDNMSASPSPIEAVKTSVNNALDYTEQELYNNIMPPLAVANTATVTP